MQQPLMGTGSFSSSTISSPAGSPSSSTSLEEEILTGLTNPNSIVHEAALLLLRAATRDGGVSARSSLCSPPILSALRPFLSPPHDPSLQSAAAATFLNLSLHPPNRSLIICSGAGPDLVNLLTTSDNAVAAIFSLAVEDSNKAPIAAVGALPPLLRLISQISSPDQVKKDAAMALYHLSSARINQPKLIKLAAVKILLRVAEEEEKMGISVIALMTLCNLGARKEGKAAMMESGAVAVIARIIRIEGLSESRREWCVTALFLMSKGSLRFRAMAKEVGVDELLQAVVDGELAVGKENGKWLRMREMAKRALRVAAGEPEKNMSGYVSRIIDEV